MQDSLDGQGNQNQLPAAPPALPATRSAFWFNASPKATQDLPKATQDLPAPSTAAGSRQEVSLLSPPALQEESCRAGPVEAPQGSPQEDQQEPAACTALAQMAPAPGRSDPEEAAAACAAAPAPEEQEGGHGADEGFPMPEAVEAPEEAPSPMVPPPGKENESMQTPAAAKVKGGKEKRASGGPAPG